jgi:hypothetical protein
VALVEMIGELGGTFGHGVTYDANLHTTLRRRYRATSDSMDFVVIISPSGQKRPPSLSLERNDTERICHADHDYPQCAGGSPPVAINALKGHKPNIGLQL